ncbi:MAG: LmeA family phospholipid-binding protein [Rubrobacteraceae bacterium]|nr:DUF2993 domain-containing protein [Rubrobacter sp.]
MRRLISAGLVAVVVLALIAGAVALIGSYTFLPPILESAVARDVQDQFDLTEAPEVRLESDPQPAMLTGTFSGGRVSMRGVELGGVRAESAIVDLEPFDVDVSASLVQGEAVGEEPLAGNLRVQVSEAEISHLAGEEAGTPVDAVELEDGRMLVRSAATVFGIEVPVSVTGSLNLHEENLVFEPKGLRAAGVPVPGEVSDQLLAEAAFTYPLKRLPAGARITGARVEEGRLVLKGEIDRIPLGASG